MLIKFIKFFLIIFVLTAMINISFAQETGYTKDEINTYPWESQTDYTYFDEASHFWNLNFRPGTGAASINCIEYLEFETKSDFLHHFTTEEINGERTSTPSVLNMNTDVQDYWSGIKLGGVIYKYFHLMVEGGIAHKTVNINGVDEYNVVVEKNLDYEWDITFNAELRFGMPLNRYFTIVGVTAFRLITSQINDYEIYHDEIDENGGSTITDMEIDIPTEIYIFNAQIMVYFELLEFDKETSLNLFLGIGYIKYRAIERYKDDYGLVYNGSFYPEKVDNAELISGVSFIINNHYMIELKCISVGIFRAQLVFSYLI